MMEDFTELDCGCYVGFDVNHKPMWGKQCPLHKASKDMFEALTIGVRLADAIIQDVEKQKGKTPSVEVLVARATMAQALLKARSK